MGILVAIISGIRSNSVNSHSLKRSLRTGVSFHLHSIRVRGAVPQRYKQIREPTPAIPSSDEEDDNADDPIDLLNAHSASVTEPTSYKQSQQRPEVQLWHTACEEEMEAHRVNGTWDVVKLPPGKCAIGSRWFMKVKHNADGSLDRYKARLVAKGYSQRPGIHVATFRPVMGKKSEITNSHL